MSSDVTVPAPAREAHVDTEPDLVRSYLNEIGRIPLLDASEEVDLAKRIEAGVYAEELLRSNADGRDRRDLRTVADEGARAKERMIRANLRLVVAAAKKRRGGLSLLDLIQEGNLGLMRAVEKFDYTKGYKFSTYAMWWIRQAMQRGDAFQSRAIRLPSHLTERIGRLNRAERELIARLEREPTDAELADATGYTTDAVQRMRSVSRVTASLDVPVGEDGESSFGEFMANQESDDQRETAAERAELVAEALAALEPLTARVLAFRYGLYDGNPHTLQETGQHVGLSRERVRRLERQAFDELRATGRREALAA
ncbi:sigma-70 family RNA polymerase sigma factor [Haloechinothrix salitolerans]|uniref:RNA polymerase sigma factor n=1 Tax=Haloechinothrix salitolerans TaxID=926830 RepID=A0ABW2C848_9PSEU